MPVIPSQVQVLSAGGIADLTGEQQGDIGQGTVVTTTDGQRWVYRGSGSKTSEVNYLVLADVTPEWPAISNKPALVAALGSAIDLAAARLVLELGLTSDVAFKSIVARKAGGVAGTDEVRMRVADSPLGGGITDGIIEHRHGAGALLFYAQGAMRLKVTDSILISGHICDEATGAGSLFIDKTGSRMWTQPAFQLCWRDSIGGNVVTGVGQPSAGLVEINNGTMGAYRDLRVRSLTTTAGAPRVAYVESTGNDATAAIGNDTKPYATVQAAIAAIEASEQQSVVFVGVGEFAGYDGPPLVYTQAIRGCGAGATNLGAIVLHASIVAGNWPLQLYDLTTSIELYPDNSGAGGGHLKIVGAGTVLTKITALGGNGVNGTPEEMGGDGGFGGNVTVRGAIKVNEVSCAGGEAGGDGGMGSGSPGTKGEAIFVGCELVREGAAESSVDYSTATCACCAIEPDFFAGPSITDNGGNGTYA
ncbi:MAG: hypothetical protein QM775_16675 [Pirellulales bacterium]